MGNIDIRIIDDKYIEDMVRIEQGAYASAFEGTEAEREKLTEIFTELCSSEDIMAVGAYKGEELVGTMLYYIFKSNFHGTMIEMAGIGSVAVDLLHKKEKVGRALIEHSIKMTQERNIPLFSLYPFRPKFYRNFGFGFGNPLNVLKVAPEAFKDFSNKYMLSHGTVEDIDEIVKFHDGCVENQHGMAKKSFGGIRKLKKMEKGKFILAKRNDELIGYMVFTQEGLSDIHNQEQNIIVQEMFYSERSALLAFSSFFNSQKDQVTYVQLHTFDKAFHNLLDDLNYEEEPRMMPLISHKYADVGLGMMFLAANPEELLKLVEGRTKHSVKFNLLYPRQTVMTPIVMNPGKEGIEINIKINEFSSWIMGAASLKELYEHGALETDHPEVLREIDYDMNFEKPECHNTF